MKDAPQFFIEEEKNEEKSSPHIVFLVLLIPAVFVLTKIGELTVNILILLGKLVFSIGLTCVAIIQNVVKTITLVPKLLKVFADYKPTLPWYIQYAREDLTKLGKSLISLELTAQRLLVALLHKAGSKKSLPSDKKTQQSVTTEVQVIQDTSVTPIPMSSGLHLLAKVRYFLSGILVGILIVTPFILQLWISELPDPRNLSAQEPALTTKLYDRNGRLLFQFFGNENRTKISLSDIPAHLIDATIAIEDKNFYQHAGFDLVAIMRAARETLINKNIQGGSTITQQLIKSTFLTPHVSMERKVKELVLAFWAERLYSKDQILEMYFNQVPYGGTAWGIEAAALTYFGKHANDLRLSESALLAGLPSGPSLYSPFGATPDLAKQRQLEVLDRMKTLGFITSQEAEDAAVELLAFAPQVIDIRSPHFVMYVKGYLIKRFGIRMVEQGGLLVTTTLDLDLQERAQNIVQEELVRLAPLSVGNGAALITDPKTGEILAMVGSKDYFDTTHNGNVNVTTALRQPGSSIKIVTYAAALEKGLTAASMLDDSPITYNVAGSPPYSPVNYDGRFHGKVTLRNAFGNSYNVPAVKTLAQIGVPTMLDMGRRLGITTWNDDARFGLSLTLGGGEVKMVDLATAYGTVAAGGIRHDVSPVLKITNSKGEVFEDRTRAEAGGIRILSEGIAFILADILADNNARSAAFGTNSILQIPGAKVSVKTGTSDNKRDNWTVGFSKDRLITVWVGNMDNSPMNPTLTSGVTGAAPIWNRLMTTVLAQTSADQLANQVTPPADVIAVSVCTVNGLLPCGGCPTRTEYFVSETQPKLACRPDLLTPAPAIGGN